MTRATAFIPEIGPIEVTISVRETHSMSAEISEHPIESGSVVADHVQTSGLELTMEGMIANVKASADEIAGPTPQQAYTRIQAAWERRQAIVVLTSLKIYKDMILKSVSITRDKDTAAVLNFTAELKQVRIARAGTVVVIEKDRHTGTSKLGSKSTETAPDKAAADAKGSMAFQGIGGDQGARSKAAFVQSLLRSD